MPRPTRKANSSKSTDQKLDVYHNRFDQPCCRLLQEIKDAILNPNETEKISLASAIRHYLQTEGKQDTSLTSISNNQTKKKSKKKKKKKKADSSDDKIEGTEGNDGGQSEPVSELADTPTKDDALPSSMERRRRLLHNFLAKSFQKTTVVHRSPSSSLRSFVEYLTEKQIRCKISPSVLQQAVNDIACESCRKSVQEHLHKNSMLILNFGGLDDEREEAHFDYVAMEEGLGQEKERWYFVRDSSVSSQPRGSRLAESLEDGIWELHYSAASLRDGNSLEHTSNPYEWERFLFLLENGILLPALSIDDILGFDCVDKTLPEALVKDILDRVYRLCERREDSFCKWATQLGESITTFQDQTAMHRAGGNIEMSSFAIMKSTDETCQQILRNLFAIMWEVTQHIISVTSFSHRHAYCDSDLLAEATEDEKKWWSILQTQRQADHSGGSAFSRVLGLWHDYSETMETISVESAKYEKKLEEQSSAQGKIPAMYCSAEVRELYRQLVIAKYRATYHLIDRFQTHLDAQVNLLDPLVGKEAAWNVNWFRYLIAQATYRDILGDLKSTRKKKNGSTLSFDEMLETVVLAVAKWTMESIHQGTIQKILMEHEQRRKGLSGLVEKLFEAGERCFAQSANETHCAPYAMSSSHLVLRELKGLHDDLLNDVCNTDISSIDRGDALSKIAALRLNLWNRCVVLFSKWLPCSVYLNFEEVKTANYDYGWLTLASTTELPFILRKELYLQQTGRFAGPCSGGSGSFRVESMLLGLFFRWMDERYKEWQAIVAEQELLSTMSEEIIQAPSTAILGKKNKKKRTESRKVGTVLEEPINKMSQNAASTDNGSSPRTILSIASDNLGHTSTSKRAELLNPGESLDTQSGEASDFVAQREVPFATPEQTTQVLQNTASGKKNKKKKENKKTAINLHPFNKIPEVAPSEDGHSSGIAAEVLDHAKSVSQAELLHGIEEIANDNKGCKDESTIAIDDGLMGLHTTPPKMKSISSIGVLDGDKFYSAEEYLVNRLITVLKLPANTVFISR